jgi:hypothetical protein
MCFQPGQLYVGLCVLVPSVIAKPSFEFTSRVPELPFPLGESASERTKHITTTWFIPADKVG